MRTCQESNHHYRLQLTCTIRCRKHIWDYQLLWSDVPSREADGADSQREFKHEAITDGHKSKHGSKMEEIKNAGFFGCFLYKGRGKGLWRPALIPICSDVQLSSFFTMRSKGSSVSAALSSSSLYSSSSHMRCRVFRGSLSSTGMDTLDKSFPMLFLKMFQRLMLLVSGQGAGR